MPPKKAIPRENLNKDKIVLIWFFLILAEEIIFKELIYILKENTGIKKIEMLDDNSNTKLLS